MVVYLKAGTLLAGKYQILKPLGRGGEGSVWLALHRQTEQLWAVKEISRKGDGREFHELNMMKKLRHPSLPTVMDVWEDEGHIYLIMEYIRGCTMAERMKKQGKLTAEQAVEVGVQLSGALIYLHSRAIPVFHLDIKPANIIQKRDGRLVLVDFGSARREMESEGEKQRYGTEGFAAPEQYDRNRELDGRADIYGLGATLYYLVSGVRYASFLQKSRIPGCPEALGEVIRKCLREEPRLRYENSRKLYRRLVRLKRRYAFRRQRCRFWAALALALAALGVAMRELSQEFAWQAEQNWSYEKLLEELLCVREKEQMEYYRRAVYLEPKRKEAYLQFIRQADSDAGFSREEETNLRALLHTIPLGQQETYEELLAENSAAYGEVASALGMVYWYDYEGEEGKRIASGWFTKAVEAGKKLWESGNGEVAEDEGEKLTGGQEAEPWFLRAEIFAHMGSYYERLGKRDETGERSGTELEYWQDMRKLLDLEGMEIDNPVTQLRLYAEAVNQIIFLAEELRQQGVSVKELLETVEEITLRVTEFSTPESSSLEGELAREILSRSQIAKEMVHHLENRE